MLLLRMLASIRQQYNCGSGTLLYYLFLFVFILKQSPVTLLIALPWLLINQSSDLIIPGEERIACGFGGSPFCQGA
jgi:hypothetical protein